MTEPQPSQPRVDGEPVFDAPWQARTFAMAVHLHEAGLFTWGEWSERLARRIAARERRRPIAGSDDYYRVWQDTLEALVAERAGT